MLRLIFRASSITVLLLLGFPLTGSVDTTIKFWDIKTGKEARTISF
jgi:WD40 repeat protein